MKHHQQSKHPNTTHHTPQVRRIPRHQVPRSAKPLSEPNGVANQSKLRPNANEPVPTTTTISSATRCEGTYVSIRTGTALPKTPNPEHYNQSTTKNKVPRKNYSPPTQYCNTVPVQHYQKSQTQSTTTKVPPKIKYHAKTTPPPHTHTILQYRRKERYHQKLLPQSKSSTI